MASGHQLLAAAQRFRGEPYSTAGGRTSPSSGYKDCSGLICAAYQVATGRPCGGTVSTSIETWAVRSGGRYISRAEALATPGACAAIWGLGPQGHIGFTTGDGRIFETPSDEGRRVGFSRFDRNRWTRFFTLPGIDYGAGPAPTPHRRGDSDVTVERSDPQQGGNGSVWAITPRNAIHLKDGDAWKRVSIKSGGTHDKHPWALLQTMKDYEVPDSHWRGVLG